MLEMMIKNESSIRIFFLSAYTPTNRNLTDLNLDFWKILEWIHYAHSIYLDKKVARMVLYGKSVVKHPIEATYRAE